MAQPTPENEFLLCKCSACKPSYFMEKINKKLFIYGRFSIMSNTIYEKINVEDNNFANIFRMDRNSAYVFFLKNQQSQIQAFFRALAVT